MAESRLERWAQPLSLGFSVAINDRAKADRIIALQKELRSEQEKLGDASGFTISTMIRSCRELIFDVVDGKTLFHAVSYSINGDTLEIQAEPKFEISASPDQDEDDELRHILAIAAIEEVPVYPNTSDLAPRLAEVHRKMLSEGFTAPDGKGGRMRLKQAARPTTEFTDPKFLTQIDCTTPIYPAEVEIIRGVLFEELSRLGRAEQVLASLDVAVDHLSDLLESPTRNENSIQRCVTKNPILFGTEYYRIIPKHRLGSEYEMDYAAEKINGIVDLIEIESSNLNLYNKSGNPTSHLVHAEQQVLDWISWIERNNSYARDKLPGLVSPVGYVVIGRRSSLSAADLEKLARRNVHWRGQVQILTYDDLLDRAKNLKAHLEALRNV